MAKNILKDLKNCDYQPKEILGKGTFGVVFLTERSGKSVALKYADTSTRPNWGTLASTVNEIVVLKDNRHSQMFTIQGNIFYGDEKYPFCTKHGIGYAMPQAEGSLNKVTDLKLLKQCYADIISTLSFLHNRNVIHCDLKPYNALFLKGRGYLSDFGACLRMTRDNIKVIDGIKYVISNDRTTYNYAAPEVYAETSSKYSKEADIWAIGMMLYDQLFDYDPDLNGRSEHEKFYKQRKEFPVEEKHLKDEYKDDKDNILSLLRQILVIDPKKRLPLDAILDHAFFRNVDIPEDGKNYDGNTKFEYEKDDHQKMLDIITLMPVWSRLFAIPRSIGSEWLFDAADLAYRSYPVVKPESEEERDMFSFACVFITLVQLGYEVFDNIALKIKASIALKYIGYILASNVPTRKPNLKDLATTNDDLWYIWENFILVPEKYIYTLGDVDRFPSFENISSNKNDFSTMMKNPSENKEKVQKYFNFMK